MAKLSNSSLIMVLRSAYYENVLSTLINEGGLSPFEVGLWVFESSGMRKQHRGLIMISGKQNASNSILNLGFGSVLVIKGMTS